ncbi:MAG TPA: hypothetical protein VHS29_00075 [Candidatus Acidoferrales bacterium]|jgi:hypothetical protein|nr:hypothetical protein [Candidatus Acidoferrales bacterium]
MIVSRPLKKVVLNAAISAFALLIVALLASQIGQYMFRRRVERLLTQFQSLELGDISWHQAQIQLKEWDKETKLSRQCNQTECSEQIVLIEPAWIFAPKPIFLRLDDYLRWRLKLTYSQGPFSWMAQHVVLPGYMLMGGRPARSIVTVGMHEGVVPSLEFFVGIETYRHHNLGGWNEYTLGAVIRGVPRFDVFDRSRNGAQLTLHPNYLINRPSGCEGCEEAYVYFTPSTEPADVLRLVQPNLSCLTRILPCLDEIDILPAAWKQHLAETSRK